MRRRADLALVLVTLIWGTTFTVVHTAVATFPPVALIFLRFALATLALGPLLWRRRRTQRLRRHGLLVGIGLGSLLFFGFATQTLGLALTSPARAGFITGLNVVLVPMFAWLWGERPGVQALLGVGLASVGLMVLTWGCGWAAFGCSLTGQQSGWHWGDSLILLCAAAFALHIVAVGRWGMGLPLVALNGVQLATVAMLAGGVTLMLPTVPWSQPTVWAAASFLGIIATALVFGLQLWAQRWVNAARTALIFALEPIFAALFAWWWIGDRPTTAVWVGGALMVAGILASEVPLSRPATQPFHAGS
ncbi:MAG: DMT family transporter [Herpetosiphonaceae bacterium]|nr:DMT family transporter [Herpetosiphonaceae bacterium]